MYVCSTIDKVLLELSKNPYTYMIFHIPKETSESATRVVPDPKRDSKTTRGSLGDFPNTTTTQQTS